MAFRLAELFIEIGARAGGANAVLAGLHSRLMGMGTPGQAVSSMMQGLTSKFMGLHAAIGSVGIMAGVALAGAVAVGLAHCAMQAGHLQEAVGKVERTFGTATPLILAQADLLAKKFGAIKTEILDVAASYGKMLQGSGIGKEASAEMSAALTERAVDISRDFDISVGEATARMQSGLAGEMEAVRRWGANLSEANLKRQAMAAGWNGKGELSQDTKTLLRFNIMMKATEASAGAAAKEQYGLIAQWELFTGTLTRIGTTLGQYVAPAFVFLLATVNTALGWLATTLETLYGWTSKLITTLLGLFGIDLGKGAEDARRKAEDARIEKAEAEYKKDSELAKISEKETDPKGWMGGVGENWKHVQEAIFSRSKDSLAKDSLAEAKLHTKLLEDIKTRIKDRKEDKLGP